MNAVDSRQCPGRRPHLWLFQEDAIISCLRVDEVNSAIRRVCRDCQTGRGAERAHSVEKTRGSQGYHFLDRGAGGGDGVEVLEIHGIDGVGS